MLNESLVTVKTSSPNKKVSHFQLSEAIADKTFKNVLRGGDGEKIHKEHRMIYFKEQQSKKKEEKNVFDDSYQQKSQDLTKQKKKYENYYLKGSLKTNIVFDDKYKTNEIERFTHVRTQTAILKNNPVSHKQQVDLTKVKNNNPSLIRKLNDTFNTNPMENLTTEQHNKMLKYQHQKTIAKFNRVSNYLGSEAFKSTIGVAQSDAFTSSDKITNKSVHLTPSSYNEPKVVKSFKHFHSDGKVFYG